ncbi:MAG: hypothetical protein EZS28_001985 [Streblomastix strix]|uniref:Uncharacterized protein n=1 Tax=Streblomastix strix TaxID=222440 RepID=A0A5J4X5M6_9EUKA|nr:MAG: hypothetical protein EZS28_001985 [Streblomastix strix]
MKVSFKFYAVAPLLDMGRTSRKDTYGSPFSSRQRMNVTNQFNVATSLQLQLDTWPKSVSYLESVIDAISSYNYLHLSFVISFLVIKYTDSIQSAAHLIAESFAYAAYLVNWEITYCSTVLNASQLVPDPKCLVNYHQ